MKKILAFVSLLAVAVACGGTPNGDVNVNAFNPADTPDSGAPPPAPSTNPVVDAGQPEPSPVVDAGPSQPGVCTFVYSNWGTCVNLKQTRQVESYSPPGCTGNSVTERSCVDPDSCAGAGQEPFNCGTYTKKNGSTEVCGATGYCGQGFTCTDNSGGVCKGFNEICWKLPEFKPRGSCVHTVYDVDANNCVRTVLYKTQQDYYGTFATPQYCDNQSAEAVVCNNQSVLKEDYTFVLPPVRGNPTHSGSVGGVQYKYVSGDRCYQYDLWYYPNKTKADAQADAKSSDMTYIDP